MEEAEEVLEVWGVGEVLHHPSIQRRVLCSNILLRLRLPLHLKDKHLSNNKQCKVKDLQLAWRLRNQDNSHLLEQYLQIKAK